MIEVKLPSLGADMDQGTLLEWQVKPGDEVKKGDILAVVDTTKAALEVESWHAGTVLERLIEPGQTVTVGTPILRLREPGEAAAAPAAVPTAAPTATPAAAPTAAAPAPPIEAAPPAAQGRRAVSPAARRRAAERGVALDGLRGSGPGGAVTQGDVVAAAGAAGAAGAAPGRDRSAGIRRAIGLAMARSKREIPHYYLSDDVPLGTASEWLRTANQGRPITGRLLMAALYLRALARAAQRHPDMNGLFVEGEYRPSAAVHVGVAISLRGGGLIAPAIHSVESKSVDEVMHALGDLVTRARAGQLRRDEFADSTITLTNLGERGVTAVHGIIYPPQVALVGFGEVRDRPWVVHGQVAPAPVVTVTLAADHRVSDGHAGARFLADLGAELQAPEKL